MRFSTEKLRKVLSISSRRPVLFGIVAAMALTAVNTPAPSPSLTLHSGTEGTKAALVRIELQAVAEIAHIDHTTGEVDISRGRSTVPLGSTTGVLTSADGIVATTWENLAVDEDAVAVYAANELFAEEIGVPVVGNDGDAARRGSTPDPYWKPHLQHCYDQVTHCVLFRVAQYHVRTYTAESGGVMAELLNTPSEPHDVALLRISGGGGAPTATLAAPEAAPGPDTVLLGFTERPTSQIGPAEISATVDAETGRIESSEDLEAPLDAGVSGGPVIDRATGHIIGLTGPQEQDGSVRLVSASDIQAAMEEAGVEASPSKFDAVFRRGIDHLSAGNPGGSAESALEESLTYYDSALATSHLEQARAMRGGQATEDPAAAASDVGTEASLPVALLPILAGILILAGIVVAILLRRRGRSQSTSAGGGTPSPGTDHRTSAPATAASVPQVPKDQPGASDKPHARPTAARAEPEQTGSRQRPSRVRTNTTTWTRSAEYHMPGEPHVPMPPAQAPSAPNTNLKAQTPDSNDDATRTAGHLAPRAAGGPISAFCSHCGRSLPSGARFCPSCGNPVG